MSIAILDERKKEALEKLREVAERQLATKSPEEIAKAKELYRMRNRILFDYPDKGPLRRELYKPHLEFFKASAEHSEISMICANRIGKTYAAADAVSYHMTGLYPKWWEGRVFKKATTWWTANESWQRVRDVNQLELLGIPDRQDLLGTGSIPHSTLVKPVPLNPHIKFGFVSFQCRHVSGGISSCQFKTYEQGWKEFEGTKITGGIWLDENCPMDIYSACKARVMNTDGPDGSRKNGLLMLTFTPIEGLTPLLMNHRDRAVNRAELGW